MHFNQGLVPLQFCYQFYGSLLLIGFLTSCASVILAMMTIYEVRGTELAWTLSFVGLFGLTRLLMSPFSTMTDEDDLIHYFGGNHNGDIHHLQSTKNLELDIKTFVYGNDGDNKLFDSPAIRNLSCSICLQCFEIGQEVSVTTACKHVFHSECLKRWTQRSATCPYCRQDLKKSPTVRKNGERRKLPGAIGIFEGTFESIFDLTS